MDIYELIELGDVDELLREIDRLCDRRDWQSLLQLRDLSRMATERGKQLWGAAGHAEYRLALEATPEFAAQMVDADPGRFVLGPLPEVMSSTHAWDELEPYLTEGPLKAAVAYERVIRGEDLTDIAQAETYEDQFGLPLAIQGWEPQYELATYKQYELLAPSPKIEAGKQVSIESTQDSEDITDPITDALSALVNPWTSQSNGKTHTAAVNGGLNELLAKFETPAAQKLETTDALKWIAWAAANGGAHGVRPGAAAGRAKLWWLLASLAELDEEWPLPSDEIQKYLTEVEWFTWDRTDVSSGWQLRVAVVDPEAEAAFAIDAFDRPDD